MREFFHIDKLIINREKRCIPSKTILLKEGDVSKTLFYIKKGALRLWFNNDGKDITVQFFFEGQVVSSMNSFFSSTPSLFSIESIEQTEIVMIAKNDFDTVVESSRELQRELLNILTQRFQNYIELFLSRIKNSPEQRYKELLQEHPHIIKRVPQHYIASYLGITNVSLSRIRNRM